MVLIVSSFVPPVYYGFLCEPLLRNFYLLSTLLLGARCACMWYGSLIGQMSDLAQRHSGAWPSGRDRQVLHALGWPDDCKWRFRGQTMYVGMYACHKMVFARRA